MILFTLRELYVSPNGDKWEVAEDDDKRLFIRHTPNLASGGRQSIMTLASFLQADQASPQQDALNKLIESGQLVLPKTPKQHFA
jgi:hypothetical protein